MVLYPNMKIRLRHLFPPLLVSLALVSVYLYLAGQDSPLLRLSNKNLDFLLRYRYHHQPKPSFLDKIVIVDIDQNTVSALGQRWPMNRTYFALLLDKICAGKPNAVGMDFAFIGRGSEPEPDLLLAKALKENSNTVIGSYLDNQGKLVLPDELTGLSVFRYFELKLKSQLRQAVFSGEELSLAIFDIDHFKSTNDTYGHEAGNEVLKKVALIIAKNSRSTDTACRFGPEEFTVILPSANLKGAAKYAESIRKNIEEAIFECSGKAIKVTISAGISSVSSLKEITASNLLDEADKALYQAKNTGRNKVVSA